MKHKLNILIAPLDWGLGHATRCIPIIKAFENVAVITLAANKTQEALYKKEFPALTIIPLQGYNIHYSGSKRLFSIKILLQVPKILKSIARERKWLQKINSIHNFDLVISDNRYGLTIQGLYSVIITHQLSIQAPLKWLERIIRILNYKFINRFNECWVPDIKGSTNIAGKLSHPGVLPTIPVYYTGPLSWFKKSNSYNTVY